MSGMCYSCASRFGTFNKEMGCRNCGFAFCKKCITKKAAVPKMDNKIAAVCEKCFKVLSGKVPSQTSAQYEPPDALLKRLAALEQDKNNSAAMAAPAVKKAHPAKHRGMNKEDVAMAERLEKLKKDRNVGSVPSQSEIEARLAKLKQQDETTAKVSSEQDLSDRLASSRGQTTSSATQPFVFRSDQRYSQHQVDSLLEEIGDEVMIDERLAAGSVRDIQDRLNQLKSGSDIQNNINESPVNGDNLPERPPRNVLNIPPSDSAAKPDEPSWAEINRLVRDTAAEAEMEANQAIEGLKKDKELWNRVQQLKDARHSKRNTSDDNVDSDSSADVCSRSSNEDSDTAAGAVIQQALEENALDEKCDDDLPKTSHISIPVSKAKTKANISGYCRRDQPQDSAEGELPWCCICNNDATLRCAGCDGDLYCQRCYREGHDRFQMRDHQTSAYSSHKK